MADYQQPTTDHEATEGVDYTDFNRIETNTQANHEDIQQNDNDIAQNANDIQQNANDIQETENNAFVYAIIL